MSATDSAATAAGARATRVLLVGCGRMGGALLGRWVHNNAFDFTAVSPSGAREFPDGVQAVRGAEALEGQCFDLLVVGVKPQQISTALPAYMPLLQRDGLVVSLAAGFSVASLADLVTPHAVCRVMPNLPVSLGEGVSALFAGDQVSDDQRAAVQDLMQGTGVSVWVDSEDELDRVTAIAGSGPGYAFEIARCWVEAGEKLGLSRALSTELVLGTLRGSVSLALESEDALEELRDGVTSKNGTTQAGLHALNGDSQLGELFRRTVDAAYSRAVQLR